MKIPLHKNPMLVSYVNTAGKPILAIPIKATKSQSQSCCTIRTEKRNGKWYAVLDCDAIGGRKIHKVGFCPVRPSKKAIEKLVSKICRAQARAIELHSQRQQRATGKPMPPALKRMAIKEVFPTSPLSEGAFLAHVAVECGELHVREELSRWSLAGNHSAVQDFHREWPLLKKVNPGSTKRAINLFLFTHWPLISEEGMTGEKVHKEAEALLGEDVVGNLAAFLKYLLRKGIRFARPGRPNN